MRTKKVFKKKNHANYASLWTPCSASAAEKKNLYQTIELMKTQLV